MPDQRGVAVLTGCSSGFGLLSAIELALAGFRVYATMRNPSKRDKLDRAAAEAGVSVAVLPLDVTTDESVASAFERIGAEAGRVDVLVSNAGYGMGGFVEDTSLEAFGEALRYEAVHDGVFVSLIEQRAVAACRTFRATSHARVIKPVRAVTPVRVTEAGVRKILRG